jgi:hypothetical protein
MHGGLEIGARYYPLKNVSLKAGYLLEILRISSWNFILSSSDNVFFSLSYNF